MDLGLEGKVAIITGGSDGLGLATARTAGGRGGGGRDLRARRGAPHGGGREAAVGRGDVPRRARPTSRTPPTSSGSSR